MWGFRVCVRALVARDYREINSTRAHIVRVVTTHTHTHTHKCRVHPPKDEKICAKLLLAKLLDLLAFGVLRALPSECVCVFMSSVVKLMHVLDGYAKDLRTVETGYIIHIL